MYIFFLIARKNYIPFRSLAHTIHFVKRNYRKWGLVDFEGNIKLTFCCRDNLLSHIIFLIIRSVPLLVRSVFSLIQKPMRYVPSEETRETRQMFEINLLKKLCCSHSFCYGNIVYKAQSLKQNLLYLSTSLHRFIRNG